MSDTTEPIGRLDPFVGVDIDVDEYEQMLAEQEEVMRRHSRKGGQFAALETSGED